MFLSCKINTWVSGLSVDTTHMTKRKTGSNTEVRWGLGTLTLCCLWCIRRTVQGQQPGQRQLGLYTEGRGEREEGERGGDQGRSTPAS